MKWLIAYLTFCSGHA